MARKFWTYENKRLIKYLQRAMSFWIRVLCLLFSEKQTSVAIEDLESSQEKEENQNQRIHFQKIFDFIL